MDNILVGWYIETVNCNFDVSLFMEKSCFERLINVFPLNKYQTLLTTIEYEQTAIM